MFTSVVECLILLIYACISIALTTKIYVSDVSDKRIYVANVSDFQFTELFSYDMETHDLAFDGVEQKLYWAQKSGGKSDIYKSNPDGSGKVFVFSTLYKGKSIGSY